MSRGRRCSLDLASLLLWLWCGLAAAALIQTLAWELSYATGVALKSKTKKPKKKKKLAIELPYDSAVLLLDKGNQKR